MKRTTIAFVTLGCKLNFAETSSIARNFADDGYTRIAASQKADIYIVNTCSVTAESDKKCRQTIRKLASQNPEARIIVTGCYANLKPKEITSLSPNVEIYAKSAVFPAVSSSTTAMSAHRPPMPLDKDFFSAFSSGDRTRSFLKVQDGCDYHCSYCTVPLARGHSRNISIADLQETVRIIAEQNIQEVVLTGVNIGDFGKTTGESFFELLKALVKIKGIERYRISSIEPNLLTDDMIDWIAGSAKVLPHFHIPLQSGNNKILKEMRRRYTRELLTGRVEHIKKVMPKAFVGLDVIVGFPGETDADFEDTYQFLESIQPAFLHVFPYSMRPNTPAVSFSGHLSPSEKKIRAKRLDGLCRQLHRQFYERMIGITEEVLVESTRKDGRMFGYTRNYIRVELPYDKSLAGKIVRVHTIGIAPSGNMFCKII